MTKQVVEPDPPDGIDTTNEFGLSLGSNSANSSFAQRGRRQFIGPLQPPLFRTRESAYRFAGYLVSMAEVLPNEDEQQPLTYEQIYTAIVRKTRS